MEAKCPTEDWQAIISETISSLNITGDVDTRSAAAPPLLIPSPGSPEFAKCIDHTLLKVDATGEQIDVLCEEAKEWRFKTVCVRLNYVARAVSNLTGSGVTVTCVVGFHEGTQSTEDKLSEARSALDLGASDLDMVLNWPLLLSSAPSAYSSVFSELCGLRSLSKSSTSSNPTLKLILETSQLTPPTIAAAATLAWHAGFDFVKTSTGFLGRGASVADVNLMRRVASYWAKKEGGRREMQVKASGGIRTFEDAIPLLEAGATRLGVSAGVAIMREGLERTGKERDGNSGGEAVGRVKEEGGGGY